jgi:transcriptional regulator with XRE-family HTH domain
MKSGPEQFKDWMHRRRFLQKEAAEHLGFDHTFISQLLSGSRTPGLESAITIERKTGIAVEAWLSSERDESAQPAIAGAGKSKVGKA